MNYWVLLFTFFIQSSFAQDLLANKIGQLREIGVHHELACPATPPSDHQLLVIFEGMGGYCPRRAAVSLPSWNEPSSLSSQLSAQKELLGHLGFKRYVALTKKLNSALDAEFSVMHQCFFLNPVASLIQARVAPTSVLYYSLHGARDANDCIQKLYRQEHENGHSLKIKLAGYSMGGFAALKVAKSLETKQIGIDRVLTVDPVGGGLRWINGVILREGSNVFEKPSNVGTWENVYQDIDHHAIAGGLLIGVGIRGSRVKSSDLDSRLSKIEFVDEAKRVGVEAADNIMSERGDPLTAPEVDLLLEELNEGPKLDKIAAHIQITEMPQVKDAIIRLLDK